jgi:two-component system, response regulator
MTPDVEILLAEDKQSDAELTIRALLKNNKDVKIVHVRNGKEVLDFLSGEGDFQSRDIQKMPKAILLDLKMPKLNGIEVLRRIKAVEATKKIPVVILTSSREDPDIQQCYALGANSYIVKPVLFEDFVKVVSDLGLYWIVRNQSPFYS